MANSEISKWIKFRREFIESMSIDERKQIFPESLEDGYSWEAAGIADYILVHMPHLTQRAPRQTTPGQKIRTAGGLRVLSLVQAMNLVPFRGLALPAVPRRDIPRQGHAGQIAGCWALKPKKAC